jgi:hypothetical protein
MALAYLDELISPSDHVLENVLAEKRDVEGRRVLAIPARASTPSKSSLRWCTSTK